MQLALQTSITATLAKRKHCLPLFTKWVKRTIASCHRSALPCAGCSTPRPDFAVVRQLVSPDLLNQVSSTAVVPWVQLLQWTFLVAAALFAAALSAFAWTMLKRFQFSGTTLPLPAALVLFTSVTTFIVGPIFSAVLWFLVPHFSTRAIPLRYADLQLKNKDADGSLMP